MENINNLNIPTYRAKKINSDEWIKGFYYFDKEHYINGIDTMWIGQEIDPTTLSINFPDMKDKDNKPIFVSLNENGKGGDICENNRVANKFFAVYKYMKMWAYEIGSQWGNQHQLDWENTEQRKLKIIGIKE